MNCQFGCNEYVFRRWLRDIRDAAHWGELPLVYLIGEFK